MPRAIEVLGPVIFAGAYFIGMGACAYNTVMPEKERTPIHQERSGGVRFPPGYGASLSAPVELTERPARPEKRIEIASIRLPHIHL